MVSQLNVVNEERVTVTSSNAQVQVLENVLNVASLDQDEGKLGLALRVSGILQTTLDIEQLIVLFGQQIKPAIPHTEISYLNDLSGISINQAPKSYSNSCSYRLLVNDNPLGTLTLHRDWAFTQEEAKVLEYTLCSLVYPLRNAILYREAVQASHKDPLTGINNRAALDEALTREVRLAKRYKRPLSIIVLDIDHFKVVNDTMGHAAGDCIIKTTTERTSACIRSTDMMFRYGGEEFVVLLNNTDSKGARYLADRIRKSIERTQSRCNNKVVSVTVSAGVATLCDEESEMNFFTRADKALYRAKNDGRNCVRTAKPLKDKTPV